MSISRRFSHGNRRHRHERLYGVSHGIKSRCFQKPPLLIPQKSIVTFWGDAVARALNSNVAIKTSKYMHRLKLNHHLCHLIGNGGPTGPVSLSIFWSVSHPTLFPSCSLATRAEKIQNISHSVCLNFVFIKKYCKSKTRIRPQTTGFKSSSSDGVADVILR